MCPNFLNEFLQLPLFKFHLNATTVSEEQRNQGLGDQVLWHSKANITGIHALVTVIFPPKTYLLASKEL